MDTPVAPSFGISTRRYADEIFKIDQRHAMLRIVLFARPMYVHPFSRITLFKVNFEGTRTDKNRNFIVQESFRYVTRS